MLRVALVVAFVVGCVKSAAVICDDGTVCPALTTCDPVHGGCITKEQRDACVNVAEGDRCSVGALTGECRDAICFPDRCGDGLVTGPEQCDGADLAGLDCTASGFYEPDGLACSASCEVNTDACKAFCGDHEVNGPELCDSKAPALGCFDLGYDLGPLGCSAGCGPDLGGCRRTSWELAVTTETSTLNAVWAVRPDDVYAVGEGGSIQHYDGTRWVEQPTSTNLQLRGVWGTSSQVFAVGTQGTILRNQNGVWSVMTSNTAVTLFGVFGTSDNDVWAVGQSATVLHFDGNAWTVTTGAGGATEDLRAVWARSPQDVFAVGTGGRIVHYNGSWSIQASTTSNRLNSVWGGATKVIAVGANSESVAYDGQNWGPGGIGAGNGTLVGLWGTSDRNMFAVNDGGKTLHYDGARWREIGRADTALGGIGGSGGDDIFAVGPAGTIFHSTGTWWISSITTTLDITIQSVWAASPTDVFAVGAGGNIFRYDGNAWTAMTSGVTVDLHSVWGTSSNDVYAVGDSRAANARTILHYTGSGVAWSTMTAPAGANLRAIFGTGGMVFAVGGNGEILQYDGTWSAMASPAGFTTRLNAIWGTTPTNLYAVGDNRSILQYDGTWTAVMPPMNGEPSLNAIVGTSATNIWAVGNNGVADHYDGATWSSIPKSVNVSLTAAAIGPDGDLIAAGKVVLHRRSNGWTPIRSPAPSVILGVASTSEGVFFVGAPITYELVRTTIDCGIAETTCGNYFDDDCDGKADACDSDCAGLAPAEHCANIYDDDCDGLSDCMDPDCATTPTCMTP